MERKGSETPPPLSQIPVSAPDSLYSVCSKVEFPLACDGDNDTSSGCHFGQQVKNCWEKHCCAVVR